MVTVDFEPWEEGITFQVATHVDIDRREAFSQSEIATYQTALETGIREELAELGSGTTVAVVVVLRSMRLHDIDSRPESFHAVGHVAVRNAFALAYRRPPETSASRR